MSGQRSRRPEALGEGLASCAEASSALDHLNIAGLRRTESGHATLHPIAPEPPRLIKRLR